MAAALFFYAIPFAFSPEKKGGLLAKTILALYFTAFVVGGIYQALETERTMTVKTFLLFCGRDLRCIFIHWGVQPRPSDLAEGIFIRSRLNIRGRYSRHMDFLIRETSLWIP